MSDSFVLRPNKYNQLSFLWFADDVQRGSWEMHIIFLSACPAPREVVFGVRNIHLFTLMSYNKLIG